ncbi:DNA polymerase III subunit delta [Poriferisphaera corsica]|uniref:DNA polymerase III subunit delta n=1 Tax=Poriferisphaera corsica TaxID=2528020 RepID=A0A517YTW4_9BACT|nr:DNA polymerase III subunit delta [Poriferisphaera corsica]QDU33666.1 DNA polymerase III subunit delta [Poriferisphaera corsica]
MAKKKATSKPAATVDASTRILVLHGPDEMQKREHLTTLRNALAKQHGEVETFNFDSRTATLADVFDELRAYSLMMTYKIVIVEDADQFVKSHRDALERYADAPVDHATLILRANTWHRGNLDKKITPIGAIIKCEPATQAQAIQWAVKHCKKQYKTEIDRPAAQLLVERLGPDLLMLDTELGKLSLMTSSPDQPITAQLVEQTTQKGSDEEAWAIQEAILDGIVNNTPGKSIEMLHELIDLSGKPDVLVMYFVADLMRKFANARSMKLAKIPDATIAKQLKLWGPRQQKFFRALSILGSKPGAIATVFDNAVQMDKRSKSGLGNALSNLETFTFKLGAL